MVAHALTDCRSSVHLRFLELTIASPSFIMNLDPPPISTIRCELKKFRDAQRDSVSLLVTIHGKLSDPAASYTLDNAIADIKQFETDLCKIFDGLVNTSNSTTAYYHALVQKHGEREHMIKELTASGNSNVVTNHIQLLQNNKTEIERTMLSTEEIQHHIWIGIASIHFIQSHRKWEA